MECEAHRDGVGPTNLADSSICQDDCYQSPKPHPRKMACGPAIRTHLDSTLMKELDMKAFNRLWPGLGRDILLNHVIASVMVPRPLRWRVLRLLGMPVERSRISPGVWFGSTRVAIGEDTFINYGCIFNTAAPITVGSACDVGMGVLFITGSHQVGLLRRAGKSTEAPITVGDGTWIGARATILPGSVIGERVVIAAGAVVAGPCHADGLYAGVPARRVKELTKPQEQGFSDGQVSRN